MERNIYDVNREPYTNGFAEPFGQRLAEIRAAGFFGDLTKKLVSSAGEKAASAIGAKAGEALGNKLFNRQKKKPKSPSGPPNQRFGAKSQRLEPPKASPAVEENKGSELVKLLQVENKLQSAASRVNNIHEIYNRLLNPEGSA